MTLAPLFNVTAPERLARIRSLALAARLLCGQRARDLEQSLRAAERDADRLPEALAQIDALDALDRRRLLAAWQMAIAPRRHPRTAA